MDENETAGTSTDSDIGTETPVAPAETPETGEVKEDTELAQPEVPEVAPTETEEAVLPNPDTGTTRDYKLQ